MGGNLGDVFPCIFYSTGPCYLIKTIAGAAGYPAYEPVVFWIAAIAAVVGIIAQASADSASVSNERAPSQDRALSNGSYDRSKWNALLRFDPEIAAAAEQVKPFGQRWMDEFAQAYLDLNQKSYLPQIVQKIISEARLQSDGTNRAGSFP